MPVDPSPAPQTPAPQQQVKPNGQPPAAPAAPDPVAEAKKLVADAEAKLAAAEKRARVHAIEARKFADEKKGIGAKLSEYEQLKKRVAEQDRLDAQAKLNKAAFLKAKFGDDWYDQIVAEKMNGGAPTADTVALEVERATEKLRKEFEEREVAREKAQREADATRVQNELRAFQRAAVEFANGAVKDFPILETLGDEEAVGDALVTHIRAEYDRTTKRDDEGNVIAPGRVLTMKEAAEAVEARLLSIAERAASVEKYKQKLTAQPKPAQTSTVGAPQNRSTAGQGVPQAERRTLSNDLTGSTTGRQPATTDDERRRRAIEAFNAARSKAPSQ